MREQALAVFLHSTQNATRQTEPLVREGMRILYVTVGRYLTDRRSAL